MAELFDPQRNYDQTAVQGYESSPYVQDYSAQAELQPYVPQEYAPASYAPANEHAPQGWNSQGLSQPQTPMHHMPPPPVFALPPGLNGEPSADTQEPAKTSRFKLKRGAKVKAPKLKKQARETTDKAEAKAKKKTSPAVIFVFGMAAGIALTLMGNAVIGGLTSDSSSDFREIERRALKTQQPKLPVSEVQLSADAKAP